MEEFLKGRVVFEATTHIKIYGKQRLESWWCAKESTKTLPIDTLWLCIERYHGCVRCSYDEELLRISARWAGINPARTNGFIIPVEDGALSGEVLATVVGLAS